MRNVLLMIIGSLLIVLVAGCSSDDKTENPKENIKQESKEQTQEKVEVKSLTSDPQSPQAANTTIKFTAEATGGKELEYQFYVKEATGWVVKQEYSPNNVYEWVPSSSGEYRISVYVRDKGADEVIKKNISYTIN
jgi:uncharacterized protein YcfL